MKKLLASITSAAFVVMVASVQADLLMYEPFDYPAGDRLGGSGTSPLGKTNANGQQWITRSPANGGTYDPARDTLITSGNLSYPGLATSIGNSVRYGSNGLPSVAFYTDAIAIPGSPYTTGSVYYSMIVKINNTTGIPGGLRTSYAALSEDTAVPATDAGYGVITSSGSSIPLPAGAWIRNSPADANAFNLGSGKGNTDGMGSSASAPSWQNPTDPQFANQQGNYTGAGQPWATVQTNSYFIVMKYTYVGPFANSTDDTVSMWINPIASTLGENAGEVLASASGGSYYSATNATVTAALDAGTLGIQSFLLIGNAQSSAVLTKTVDVSIDELRIGTTWADVTPVPSAPALQPQIIAVEGAGTPSVTVTWTNVWIGTNYILQYNTNLSTTNWTSLAPVMAAGTTASQTDNPPNGAAARFYRVAQQ